MNNQHLICLGVPDLAAEVGVDNREGVVFGHALKLGGDEALGG